MKIVIDIPEVFEEHFKYDRFKDSFERILEDCKHSAILSGIYEFETIEMLIRAFENGTPLPKGHGRLGDLDELEQRISNFVERYASITDEYIVARQRFIVEGIAQTPTIIEADGGGEDDKS